MTRLRGEALEGSMWTSSRETRKRSTIPIHTRTISCTEEVFEQILEDPTSAMTLMSAGQLTVSNLMAAMSLQKIF